MTEPVAKSFGLKNTISKDSEHFQPESGRYHLYIAYACPFAHRAFITRQLKGLEDHIGLSIVHPLFQKTKPGVDDHLGWTFKKEDDEPLKNPLGFGSFPCKGCIPDTVNNFKTIRDLYDASGHTSTKFSVPVLWDKKNKTIVNNESGDIIRIFNSAFNEFAKNPDLDLSPEALLPKINELNEWLQENFNLGVYKAGFAQNQVDYEKGVKNVFDALEKIEGILSENRYILGDQFTETDIRLFTTLVRFDEVYHGHFKCNKKKIVDYPNILNYCREIYQMPGIAGTVNMDHIKQSYFGSMTTLNNYGIIPVGSNFVGTLQEKHNRGLRK